MSNPVRLAVLGDPLRFTLSPELHRAGAEALGLECESVALRTPIDVLPDVLERLALEGYLGCNLTMPLKESAVSRVRELSPVARRARSVNTITFRVGGMHGDTTDGVGFLDLLASLGRDPAAGRIVLLGAGGAARSLALALADAGAAAIDVLSRREPEAEPAWQHAHWCPWDAPAAAASLARATVVVNCTPLSLGEPPVVLESLARGTLVVDLTYGEELTPWVAAARGRGLEAFDGLGLLVHQARHSLTRWFGREVPLEALSAAVGWPR